MRYELTLLERLDAAQTGRPVSRGDIDPSAVVESVMANLQLVLNSREGCCETRPDFGVPDFNSFLGQFPDALPAISRTVREQIRAFEPRLTEVDVKFIPDPDQPLSLNFHITAKLIVDDKSRPVSFETVFTDDGHVSLRR
ncbi:type VI secretion system baseplate subunit TssE [Amorphus orientalis]|uniref:Type VI secretion system protein n=1 Tax=Amorphus orientalis TaxID=649198 RepID=A0AAE4ARK1_9HYPH|nr:type VI secretion system baseplate subunit TssE [Amorphus orientalis]MDQ0314292.1 type VI secretion system protein [Amorphus orientalis]